jgi:DHA2 family multidrug resistance protein-like MFS transporter
MAHAVEAHSLILIILGNTMFALGSAPGTAIVADFVVSAAPEEQSGAASALSETACEFGGALGIALLGSLTTYFYRHALVATMPAGISGHDADTALRGIGAASSLARTMDGGSGLLSAAMTAYTSAAAIAFTSSAGITILTAILAVTMFNARKSQS